MKMSKLGKFSSKNSMLKHIFLFLFVKYFTKYPKLHFVFLHQSKETIGIWKQQFMRTLVSTGEMPGKMGECWQQTQICQRAHTGITNPINSETSGECKNCNFFFQLSEEWHHLEPHSLWKHPLCYPVNAVNSKCCLSITLKIVSTSDSLKGPERPQTASGYIVRLALLGRCLSPPWPWIN